VKSYNTTFTCLWCVYFPVKLVRENMFCVWGHEVYYCQISWCCRDIMNFANSTVVIMTLFAIINYHWPICWMVCFILFVSILALTTGNHVYLVSTKAREGCNRSAEETYSFATPDPTFAFFGDPTLDFVFAFWIMITFYTLTFAILYWKHFFFIYNLDRCVWAECCILRR
jgi:hypothetical protein